MQNRIMSVCVISVLVLTAAAAVWSLTAYNNAASLFTREKWENAAPNERPRMLDDLLPRLTVGDSRTKVRQLLGAADMTELDMSAYRLTASPFSDSDWLILTFENETLTGWRIEKRAEAAE